MPLTSIIKSAHDTAVIGLITRGNESSYRKEVADHSEVVRGQQSPSLNVNKTKEMIVDPQRRGKQHSVSHIGETEVDKMSSFKFLHQARAIIKSPPAQPFHTPTIRQTLQECLKPEHQVWTTIFTHRPLGLWMTPIHCLTPLHCIYRLPSDPDSQLPHSTPSFVHIHNANNIRDYSLPLHSCTHTYTPFTNVTWTTWTTWT